MKVQLFTQSTKSFFLPYQEGREQLTLSLLKTEYFYNADELRIMMNCSLIDVVRMIQRFYQETQISD